MNSQLPQTTMDPLDASLDLLRRVSPQEISSHVTSICRLAPDLAEDLLASVDVPLSVRTCPSTHRPFLACDYNRDGDSYRSPWSGDYSPSQLADAPKPSPQLRKLEIEANNQFGIYRDLYYEGGISSVYFWDTDDGFAGVVLLKKETGGNGWDSIHVIETFNKSRLAVYKITSTIILHLESRSEELGSLDLSGNLTRQVEKELPIEVGDDSSHLVNIGTLIEDIESKLRNMLQEVYFGKTRDIMGDLRSVKSAGARNEDLNLKLKLHI